MEIIPLRSSAAIAYCNRKLDLRSWQRPFGLIRGIAERRSGSRQAARRFDFGHQPSVDRKQLQTLASCHFVEHGENVVILGPPGVGKAHLSVGLGLKAIEAGYRALFTTAAAMIGALT
jgi:DNA replication protein DnaC